VTGTHAEHRRAGSLGATFFRAVERFAEQPVFWPEFLKVTKAVLDADEPRY
jgi:hypothetical protein